ncbi:hypothetical protein THAOC_35128 [Thalassiosira oceanica]|uniref:Uncharacterized protein n=1 Tax=Thalassiosira oceanica TaxID=159749 RepID=K0R3X2_THAOC|nr:hypothetical protein THAOC_35128 [Thalassiosira oceanica]|eukprot:EJK46214.1 hypothetical protein THAOC_35128 [Thalassiosira oceanica]
MAPPIASHPRFKLGRVLMAGSGGGPEEAIDVFCALLEEAVERASRAVGNEGDGPPGDGLDAALAEYEYGNALFRAAVRREEDDGGENADSKKPAADPVEDGGKEAASERSPPSASSGDEDLALGLRAMESSLCPVMEYYHGGDGGKEDGGLRGWARDQIVRAMTSVGDGHSHGGRHGEAADWYVRARPYAEASWEARRGRLEGGAATLAVEDLRAQRRLVELDAVVCEAMLSCPRGEDIAVLDDDEEEEDSEGTTDKTASTQTRRLICMAGDRLDFAAGHYESARLGMEELIARYGRMKGGTGAVEGLDDEGKDIGYAVMLVVGAGNRLEEERSA